MLKAYQPILHTYFKGTDASSTIDSDVANYTVDQSSAATALYHRRKPSQLV